MAKRCYYQILGIQRGAPDQEIKAAFRRLAKECHPDICNGDHTAEHRFKELNEAYEALKDPQRRAAYDRFGHAAFESGMAGPGAHGFGSDFSASMSAMFDDLFGEFMGQRRPRQRSARERGADLRYNMEITLAEAYEGKTAQIRVPTSITFEVCTGSGARAGTQATPCRTCGGIGKVRATQGFFTIERTCPNCQGRGEMIENPCPACNGTGRVTRERTLSVTIPVGVEDGTRIRLAGEGEAGLRGGPPGDLYIFLSIKPHEFFQRDGAEGTESGKQFRLKARGMPVLRTKQQGDLYIQVEVETPKNLSRKQRELLKAFEEGSNANTSPESTGFFDRVKELFERTGE